MFPGIPARSTRRRAGRGKVFGISDKSPVALQQLRPEIGGGEAM